MFRKNLEKVFAKLSLVDWFVLAIYLISILLFFKQINFSDEYEHAMSGWFLINGLIPYKDYFSHHAPLPLYLGLFAFLPAWFDPMLTLRFWLLVSQFICWVILLLMTDRRLRSVLYFLILSFALAVPRLLFNQVLADSLTTFSLVGIMILLLDYWKYKEKVKFKLLLVLSGFFFISFWSTIASIFSLIILGVIGLFIFIKKNKLEWLSHIKYIVLVFILANIFLLFPNLTTNSFSDFWWSVFTYNTKYYYPFHLAGTNEELKFGFVYQIFHQFFNQFVNWWTFFIEKNLVLLQSLWGFRYTLTNFSLYKSISYFGIVFREYFRLYESFESVVFFGIGVLLIVFLIRKEIKQALIFAILFISLFFRSNEIFHWGSLFGALVIGIGIVIDQLKIQKNKFLFFLIGWVICANIFNLFQYYFLSLKKTEPYLSFQVSKLNQQIAGVTNPGDSIMVLDRNMAYYPYTKTLPACRYHYYLPWLHATQKIRLEMEGCVRSGRAKILVVPNQLDQEVVDLMPIILEKYKASSISASIFVYK